MHIILYRDTDCNEIAGENYIEEVGYFLESYFFCLSWMELLVISNDE